MKGLLLKDILMLKSYAKTVGILVAIYLVVGIWGNNIYFFAGISGILCIMMVMNAFSYDHAAKWEAYGASLPVTRSDLVGAKYLLSLVMTGLGTVITALMYLAFMLVRKGDLSELLPMTFGTMVAGAFLILVMLPCIYQFGVERARLLMMAMGVLVMLMLFLFAWLWPEHADYPVVKPLLLVGLPVVEMVCFYLSYKLSCRIYRHKEL